MKSKQYLRLTCSQLSSAMSLLQVASWRIEVKRVCAQGVVMRAYVWVMMRAYVVQWRAHSNKIPKTVCAQGVVMRAYFVSGEHTLTKYLKECVHKGW